MVERAAGPQWPAVQHHGTRRGAACEVGFVSSSEEARARPPRRDASVAACAAGGVGRCAGLAATKQFLRWCAIALRRIYDIVFFAQYFLATDFASPRPTVSLSASP
jgi:hypothetical protein